MSGSRKIDILTRVEGHGTVELLREGGKVTGARLNLFESPRFFEALLVGRRYDEVAEIACRICSICSTAHKVAALQAVEQALKLQVSRQTGLLRELAVQGGQIESHALQIFCLSLPDYLGTSGFSGLAAAFPKELNQGLRLKALGNMIQETVGGRAIHPFNLMLGGVGKVPQAERLRLIHGQLEALHDELAGVVGFVSGLPESLPPVSALPFLAASGGPPLFGDRLTASGGETVMATSAAAWLHERVEPGSNAKVSRFDGKKTFMVGPLARLKLSMPDQTSERATGALLSSSLLARAVELQQALDRAGILISCLLDEGVGQEPPVAATPASGVGTALMEAPRGTLLHSYVFDKGICTAADIITPTAINQAAMEISLQKLILLMNSAGYEEVRSSCERLIRCFDPCISCAVH